MSAKGCFIRHTSSPMRTHHLLVSLSLPLALLVACGQGSGGTGPGGLGGGGMPPPEVGVVTVATSEVGLVTELPGRLEASRVAQVRARAAGIVLKRVFK
ncbi:MAG: efflux transporter periplasmic adaptor subunit, partial [Ramlibacter sp.]|nr:efflux transporter periplasmic adaptor subunit [Ramlibacter sp.]